MEDMDKNEEAAEKKAKQKNERKIVLTKKWTKGRKVTDIKRTYDVNRRSESYHNNNNNK